jgi:hypothetical protein
MSLLPNYTALNTNVDFFLKEGDNVKVQSVSAPAGDTLSLKGGTTDIEVGANSATNGITLSRNEVTPGAGNAEFINAKGANIVGGISFYPSMANGAVPTIDDRQFHITSNAVFVKDDILTPLINSAPIGPQGWTNIQPGVIPTASVTGSGSAFATIPALGTSNISVVPGGVYSISGGVALNNNMGGNYTLTAALNNGANDSIIQVLSADAAHTNVGPLANKYLNFNTTFIPVGSNVQLYLSVPSGAPGDQSSASFSPLYITRIR